MQILRSQLPKSLRQSPFSAKQCLINLFDANVFFERKERYEAFIRHSFRLEFPTTMIEQLRSMAPSHGLSQSILEEFVPKSDENVSALAYDGPYCVYEVYPACRAANDFFCEIIAHLPTFFPLFRGNYEGSYYSMVVQERGASGELREEVALLSATNEMSFETFCLVEGHVYRATCRINRDTYQGPWRESISAAEDAVAFQILMKIESSPEMKRCLRGYASCTLRPTYEESTQTEIVKKDEEHAPQEFQSPIFEDRFLLKAFQRNELIPKMPFASDFAISSARMVLEAFLYFRKVYYGEYAVLKFETLPAMGGFGMVSQAKIFSHALQTFPKSKVFDRQREAEAYAAYLAVCEIQKNPEKYGFYLY